MAAKYTLAAGKASSALMAAERASVQLSDGSLVYVRSDGAASGRTWGLYRSADRTTEQLIAALSGYLADPADGTHTWSLAVDASDNLYVSGASGTTTNSARLQRFTKGTGATWTLATTGETGDGFGAVPHSTRLHWQNTGGGTGSAGHLLHVVVGGVWARWYSWDAGNPTGFLASAGRSGRVSGSASAGFVDSCQPVAGGQVWFAVPSSDSFPGVTLETGTITSAGALDNIGGDTLLNASQSLATTASVASVRLVPMTSTTVLAIGDSTTQGRWVAVALDTSLTVTAGPTLSGAPTGMPLVADQRSRWDAYADPQTAGRVWVAALSTPASSATSVQAIAATVSGSTITWSTAASTLDTLAATSSATTTNLVLRTCKVSKGRYVDFQASVQDAATPTYGTYGDYLLYNTAPGAATASSPVSNTGVDRTAAIPLVWAFSDPDAGDSQSKADVRYRVPALTSTWTTVTAAATTATTYSIPANTFAADAQVEWQVLTYDSAGVAATSWSASAFFTARNPTAAPSITSPTDAGTVNGANFPVQWTAAAQDAYQVRRLANNAGSPADPTVPANVYSDTGAVEDAAARQRTVVYDTNGRVEHTQVRVRVNGLWSAWASVRDTVNYTPPMTPSFTLTPVTTKPAWAPYTDALDVVVTNPTPTGGAPAAATHNVYVDDGTTEGLRRVAVISPGATWRHSTPVHGRDYTGGRVVIETVATTGATARASS